MVLLLAFTRVGVHCCWHWHSLLLALSFVVVGVSVCHYWHWSSSVSLLAPVVVSGCCCWHWHLSSLVWVFLVIGVGIHHGVDSCCGWRSSLLVVGVCHGRIVRGSRAGWWGLGPALRFCRRGGWQHWQIMRAGRGRRVVRLRINEVGEYAVVILWPVKVRGCCKWQSPVRSGQRCTKFIIVSVRRAWHVMGWHSCGGIGLFGLYLTAVKKKASNWW